MFDAALVEQCTTEVHPQTMQTLIDAESSGNPYAIAANGIEIVSQPKTKDEAITSARSLIKQGYNVSMGVAQINMHNFESLGLTVETAFDPCKSIQAGEKILSDCYARALKEYGNTENQAALQAAFSCYYSNNFQRGFKPDDSNGKSYVWRIAKRGEKYKIPAIGFSSSDIGEGASRTTKEPTSQKEVKKEDKPITAVEDVKQKKGEDWDVFSEF